MASTPPIIGCGASYFHATLPVFTSTASSTPFCTAGSPLTFLKVLPMRVWPLIVSVSPSVVKVISWFISMT